MTIMLGDTTLAATQSRNSSGSPIGPANLTMTLSPGVALREYVGAERVTGEHLRCDRGVVSFSVERIYTTPAAALEYVTGGFLSEDSEGELKFDGDTVFKNAVVSSRSVAVVGCAVAVSYTIEG